MLTEETAKRLLDVIFKEIFEQGNLEKIAEVYHQDVVGHYNQQTFSFDDIVKRARLLDEFCQDKKRFDVLNFYVVDQMILFGTRQVWLTPTDGQLCETFVFGSYRMVDDKIAEAWLLCADEGASYIELNQQFENFLHMFELSNYGKKSFFKYLADYEYFYQKERVVFSSREQEVLFFYLRGYTAKEIAKEMGVSHRTVESYIASIFDKSGCASKAELRLKLFPKEAND